MGVVQRQSLKTGIVDLVGIAIGFISMLYIYPLDDKVFGFVNFLYSYGLLLVPFLSFGLATTTIKFFPAIKNGGFNSSHYINAIFFGSLITSGFFLILFLLFRTSIYSLLEFLRFDVDLIRSNLLYVYIVGVLSMLTGIQTAYLSNFGKIALTALIKDLGYKVFVPSLVLLYYFNLVDFDKVVFLIIGFFATVLFILLLYGYRAGINSFRISYNFTKALNKSKVVTFMFFSSLTSLASILAFRIDLVMIATLISLEANGQYAKILIISNVISLPYKIVQRTSSPTISKYWKSNNLSGLNEIYVKSALNMILIGLFLFTLVWFLLDDLIAISSNPESFVDARMIFLFLAIGQLIDLISGANGSIIGYSPSYKVNFAFILTLGVLNLCLNYYLITDYGVVGAAIATCFALAVFNIAKMAFLFFKYRLLPFTMGLGKALIFGSIVFCFMTLIPDSSYVFFNLFYKGLLILSLFLSGVLIFTLSEDLVKVYNNGLSRLKSFI